MKLKRSAQPPAVAVPTATPEDIAYQGQRNQERAEAYASAQEGTWAGQPLKPWSRGRESLFVRITERDEATATLAHVPLIEAKAQASGVKIEDVMDPHGFIEQAALVLYLAAHEPEQWDHLRGNPAAFLRAAEAWADRHIQLGDEWAAIHTAVRLREAHKALIPVRRPSGASGGDEGN